MSRATGALLGAGLGALPPAVGAAWVAVCRAPPAQPAGSGKAGRFEMIRAARAGAALRGRVRVGTEACRLKKPCAKQASREPAQPGHTPAGLEAALSSKLRRPSFLKWGLECYFLLSASPI